MGDSHSRQDSKHIVRDGRKVNYWTCQNELVDECHIAEMGVNAWAVYSVILRHSGSQVLPNATHIEKATGLCRKSIDKALKKLLVGGYIKSLEIGGEF